jgi:hypothetical protein
MKEKVSPTTKDVSGFSRWVEWLELKEGIAYE